jgi:hypothetical protein
MGKRNQAPPLEREVAPGNHEVAPGDHEVAPGDYLSADDLAGTAV